MSGYTSKQEAIRQSFANYLGALISASAFEGELQKENVIALLCEELCKYTCDNTDNKVDINCANPIFQATLYLLKRYKQDMINDAKEIELNIEDSQPIIEINEIINMLDQYILNISTKGKDDE